MKGMDFEDLLALFEPSVRTAIRAAALSCDATHVVCFEDLDVCSSELGKRTAVCMGPTCTYKSPEDTGGKWLNDLPCRRQYPRVYAAV